MNLKNIVLSVKRSTFRADDPSPPGSDAAYIKARKIVLKRDDYTCQFCGYRSSKNETHHVDDDHENHEEENLLTACVLCHMGFHIAYAGSQSRASLIYLPGTTIAQGALNQLIRSLWIAEYLAKGDLKNTASTLLAKLEKAEDQAALIIGTSSPAVLGDYLASLPDDEYIKREKVLQGIYLLPSKKAYTGHLKQWVEESKNFKPEDWVLKANEKFDQWSENI